MVLRIDLSTCAAAMMGIKAMPYVRKYFLSVMVAPAIFEIAKGITHSNNGKKPKIKVAYTKPPMNEFSIFRIDFMWLGM